jgi:hypothetical protein
MQFEQSDYAVELQGRYSLSTGGDRRDEAQSKSILTLKMEAAHSSETSALPTNVKKKVKLSVYLIKHHNILDLGTRCEWSASRSRRFTSGERAPRIHWLGGCVGHRTGLDDVEEK